MPALYIGGVYAGPIAGVTDANSVTFTIPTLAAGANALIIFNATVNNFCSARRRINDCEYG